jgi:hypothetical protein
MIAFDVFVNRQKIARAGIGSDGVLTAMVTWVRRRAPKKHADPGEGRSDRQLSFSLGGFRKVGGVDEHLKWNNRDLKRGISVASGIGPLVSGCRSLDCL